MRPIAATAFACGDSWLRLLSRNCRNRVMVIFIPPPSVNAQFHRFPKVVKRFSVRVNKNTRAKLFTRIISSAELCQRKKFRFPASAGWMFPNVLPFRVSFLLRILICGQFCCHECSFSHGHDCVCVYEILVQYAFFCFPLCCRALLQKRRDPVFLRWWEGGREG